MNVILFMNKWELEIRFQFHLSGWGPLEKIA